jgi:hypothetical protein
MPTGESGSSSGAGKIVGEEGAIGSVREKMAIGWNQPGARSLFVKGKRSGRMADDNAAIIAFQRAWHVYLLINDDVDENDERRSTLERFIRKHCEAGESDPEALTVGGLAYLKKLDQLGRYSLR